MPGGKPRQFQSVEYMQRRIDLYFSKVRFNAIIGSLEGKGLEAWDDYRNGVMEFYEQFECDAEEIKALEPIEETRPLVTGLAISLDLTRQGLINYEGRPEFVDAVKKAKARVENFLENRLHDGHVAGPIFNLKNNFNWRDERTDIQVQRTHEEYLDQLDDDEPQAANG